MATATLEKTERKTSSAEGFCPGCPRCERTDAPLCGNPHPQYRNLHPRCKACGHCVLKGSHRDDGSDTDEIWQRRHAWNPEAAGVSMPSLN